MRWLFVLLIAVLVVSDILSLDMSLAPGLSAKNAVLYAIALTMVFRAVIVGLGKVQLPVVHAAFFVIVAYAMLTWLAAGLLIQYDGYDLIGSAITLKSNLVDLAIVFLATLHAVRDMRDVKTLTIALVLAVCVANVLTVAGVVGLVNLDIHVGTGTVEAGRVFGVFGHANDTGSFIACMLPAIIAVAFTSRATLRILWLLGALASLAVLLMTASRGAMVGLVGGCLMAAFLCQRFIPLTRIMLWGVGFLMLLVLAWAVAVMASPEVAQVLSERLLGQSTAIDVSEISSGRTTVWGEVLARMMMAPITLLTGYGWDTYHTMPFRYVTHNYYLNLWFALGLPGLIAFLVIIAHSIQTVRSAIPAATAPVRQYLIAFVFGFLSLAVALVFTDFYGPWLYVWLYAGVTLRAALIARETAEEDAELPEVRLRTPGAVARSGFNVITPRISGGRF